MQVLGQADGTAGSQIFALNMQDALTPFGQNVLATFDFTSIGSTTSLVELFSANGADRRVRNGRADHDGDYGGRCTLRSRAM